jgi:putative ABC transport system permease protein
MILTLVLRSLRQYALSTALTVFSLALAGGLVMTLFVVQRQAEDHFSSDRLGFDAVLGARGSQLQLVLNSIFHLETSPGNIPWSLYEAIRDEPSVDLAIPYAMGDNYLGFRIVGTTSALFEDLVFRDGGRFTLRAGRHFDPRYREAVIGSQAAARTGLRLGDRFNPYHGLSFDPEAKHTEEYLVVGVLDPTFTAADRVIWIPIEGVFRMEGHVLRGTGEEFIPAKGAAIPTQHKEVSCVLLKLNTPQAGFALSTTINRQGKEATLAYPIGGVMAELFQRLGWGTKLLLAMAYLTGLVAMLSTTAAMYNAMESRRREVAIMRALGASRRRIMAIIVLEAATVGILAAVLSFGLHGLLMAVASSLLASQTGVVLPLIAGHAVHLILPPALIGLASIGGILPAMRAYRTDVAPNLSPVS